MTFHRNPYCWHGLMNYLQVDPLARGFLYGLANINAVGWQEATFVLLKLIDEKAIAEACRQENRGYYQKSNDRQGARTPSKRAMCYVKKAMDNHSITRNYPLWDQSNQHDWVMTAWNQRLAYGATMNQPEYLADPTIVYRSLAGGKGIITWPPSCLIPGAAYEPFRGGPRDHARVAE